MEQKPETPPEKKPSKIADWELAQRVADVVEWRLVHRALSVIQWASVGGIIFLFGKIWADRSAE